MEGISTGNRSINQSTLFDAKNANWNQLEISVINIRVVIKTVVKIYSRYKTLDKIDIKLVCLYMLLVKCLAFPGITPVLVTILKNFCIYHSRFFKLQLLNGKRDFGILSFFSFPIGGLITKYSAFP